VNHITDAARRLQPGDRIITESGLRGPRVVKTVQADEAVVVHMHNGRSYLLPGAMRIHIDIFDRDA